MALIGAAALIGIIVLIIINDGGEDAMDSDPPRPVVDFATQIQPILESSCYSCHGPEKQKGKLRLDLKDKVIHGEQDKSAPIENAKLAEPLLPNIQFFYIDECGSKCWCCSLQSG